MKALFNHILKNQLTPNQFYILHCVKESTRSGLPNLVEEAKYLIGNGWITEKFKLTPKSEELLTNTTAMFENSKKKIMDKHLGPEHLPYIQHFRDMFPPTKVALHRKPLRSNIKELEQKFLWFFENYPEYDWQLILQATQSYLNDMCAENYIYTQQAKYFICKHDKQVAEVRSDLATYCQNIIDDNTVTQPNLQSHFVVS